MPDVLLKEFVPQEFHDRGYLKDQLDKPWNKETAAEIFKKLDGAESLLGKRPAVPGKDAKPEELEKFFSQWRPEKAEEYDLPVHKDAKPDELFTKTVREAFLAGNISKVQAAGFLKKMTEYGEARQKEQAALQQKHDLEFDTMAKAALGGDNKLVMERARKLINEHAPAVYKEYVKGLPDKELVVLAGVLEGVVKAYGIEDKISPKGGSGSAGGTGDAKARREEAKSLMGSKAYKNAFDPEHDATVAKVRAIYKELDAAGTLV